MNTKKYQIFFSYVYCSDISGNKTQKANEFGENGSFKSRYFGQR